MNRVNPSRRKICPVYETFADCPNGNNCEDIHVDSPFDTRTIIATIAWCNWKTSGNAEFILEDEEIITCFIPDGVWHNARAKQTDTVKLQVSERRRNDGYRFARIVQVLSPCRDFAAFSDCKYGESCKWAHYWPRKQSFHIAKVLSITESGRALEVELKRDGKITCEIFHVPNPDTWHLKTSAAGNLVILQESSQIDRDTGRHFGKFISVLHDSQALNDSHIPLENELRIGFALEQLQGRKRNIVVIFSVEKCHDHNNCKRIGVHIWAGALEKFSKKLDTYFIPRHRENKRKRNYEGFIADEIRISISSYAHSGNDAVDGPMLSPVILPRERIMNSDDEENKETEYFEAIWSVFGEDSFIGDVAKTHVAGYVVDCPKIWKTKYLNHKMRDFANKQLTMYLSTKTNNFALAKSIAPKVDFPDVPVVIPVKIVKAALAQGKERKMGLATMLGFAKRSANNFWGEYPEEAYAYSAIACNELSENTAISLTSPIGQTIDYVNQQILLCQMILPRTQLYSKSELLGILVRRFESPTMYTAMVTQVALDGSICFHFCGVTGRRRGSRWFILDEIFKGVNHSENITTQDGKTVCSEPISFLLKGLTCDEYCNTTLATLPGNRLAEIDKDLETYGVEASEITNRLKKLDGSIIEFDAPYEKKDADTRVTLQRGVQLQLQVSKVSFSEGERDDFMCLLKIGENCHLCLVHLTSPKCAFRNNRKDASELIPRSSLDEMKSAIDEKRLKTSVLKGIRIQWKDCYFSGGTFEPNMTIKPGNLLCIRKEIRRLNFVWISHGVVSEVSEERVEFLVCNLHQDQTPNNFEDGDNNFIIEVIDVMAENARTS